METVTVESVKDIVGKIASEFHGFSSAEIGSNEYAGKGANLEALVVSLARLHPRWSAEEELILPWTEENDISNEEKDPLFQTYEYSKDLFRAWREMRAAKPSADSLMTWIPWFVRGLNALCQETGIESRFATIP